MQGSGSGARLVTLSQRLSRRGWRRSARFALFGLRAGFIVAMLAHLAAGQYARAVTTARLFNLYFRRHVLDRKAGTEIYVQALFYAKMFDRIAREFSRDEILDNYILAFFAGVSQLYCLDLMMARRFLEQAVSVPGGSHVALRMLGRVDLVEGRYELAAKRFERCAAEAPCTVMSHQNYAGRYDVQTYEPKRWELENAGSLMVYDNLMQLAEDFFLLGQIDNSMRFYNAALTWQDSLAQATTLPEPLKSRIAKTCPTFDSSLPTRILSYEWVTQFGHLGLLDSYKKLAALGTYAKANYVLLAPDDKVSNSVYLSYWEPHFCIVRDPDLVSELFPFQRHFGDQFMALPSNGELAKPWTAAAAEAQVIWKEQGRGPLLELAQSHRQEGERLLGRMRIPPDAWYVGLHVREGGFYGDGTGTMSEHRSASISDYFAAIEEITSRGGWVIRLGDRTMTPLPDMPNVVDYALSDKKSELMDIFLLATSRFVIGTTSGLSTVAMSFGTPMLLTNCISNDWQLWTGDTDFVPKLIYSESQQRFLRLSEMYRMPLQGYLINNAVLRRRGYVVHSTAPADIEAAVRYKLDMVLGEVEPPTEDHPLMRRYRQSMAHNPHMFGAARPALPFLEAHLELLDPGSECQTSPAERDRAELRGPRSESHGAAFTSPGKLARTDRGTA